MILNTKNFNLRHTIESGQCFEWQPYKKGYAGIISNIFFYLYQEEDAIHVFARKKNSTVTKGTIEKILTHYFSLDTPYETILKRISVDGHMENAIEAYHGLHLIKQPHFDCLISFMLSVNTTVKNTQQSRYLISKYFGEQVYTDPEGNSFYALPSLMKFRQISEQELRSCKAGFRAKYISQAVHRIDETTIASLDSMSYEEA